MRENTITENTARKAKLWLAFLCTMLLIPIAGSLHAQEPTGKIHGHVQDPTGSPLKGGTVSLSNDGGKTAKYSFTTDDNGNYTGEGIAPGTYQAVYRNPDTPPDKMVDQIPEVKITAKTTGADQVEECRDKQGKRPDQEPERRPDEGTPGQQGQELHRS
jgi:hypothetical protein